MLEEWPEGQEAWKLCLLRSQIIAESSKVKAIMLEVITVLGRGVRDCYKKLLPEADWFSSLSSGK